jgi:hypothetical protein
MTVKTATPAAQLFEIIVLSQPEIYDADEFRRDCVCGAAQKIFSSCDLSSLRALRTPLYSAGIAGSTEPRERVSAFGNDRSRGPALGAGSRRAAGAMMLR